MVQEGGVENAGSLTSQLHEKYLTVKGWFRMLPFSDAALFLGNHYMAATPLQVCGAMCISVCIRRHPISPLIGLMALVKASPWLN